MGVGGRGGGWEGRGEEGAGGKMTKGDKESDNKVIKR